jgi:hypothetical protein
MVNRRSLPASPSQVALSERKLPESSRWVELSDDVREALTEAIEAAAKAGHLAQTADDSGRAGVIGEAERLLRRMLN